ncbi:MAG: hypothetical protein WD738_03240 [Pirellulales bacterium]
MWHAVLLLQHDGEPAAGVHVGCAAEAEEGEDFPAIVCVFLQVLFDKAVLVGVRAFDPAVAM